MAVRRPRTAWQLLLSWWIKQRVLQPEPTLVIFEVICGGSIYATLIMRNCLRQLAQMGMSSRSLLHHSLLKSQVVSLMNWLSCSEQVLISGCQMPLIIRCSLFTEFTMMAQALTWQDETCLSRRLLVSDLQILT